MRTFRSGALLVALLVASSLRAADDKPTVTLRASKSDVTVGELFTVELSASGPAGATFTFPPEAGNDKVELKTPPPPAPEKNGSAAPPPLPPGVHRYEAAAFAIGEAEIPPVAVKYRLADGTEGEVSTDPLLLRIVSVLPKEPKDQKLVDIHPPVSLGFGREFWIVLVAALLLLGALVWRLSKRKPKGVPAEPAKPETPPDVEARSALDALRAKGLLGRGELRPFYIELTEIAKRYLERRLEAPILEMTSAEMVAWLKESGAASEWAMAMRDLAGAADRIKFARGIGVVEEGERHVETVRSMIVGVELRLRPMNVPKGEEAKR
jgi:hypothetical protein